MSEVEVGCYAECGKSAQSHVQARTRRSSSEVDEHEGTRDHPERRRQEELPEREAAQTRRIAYGVEGDEGYESENEDHQSAVFLYVRVELPHTFALGHQPSTEGAREAEARCASQ